MDFLEGFDENEKGTFFEEGFKIVIFEVFIKRET